MKDKVGIRHSVGQNTESAEQNRKLATLERILEIQATEMKVALSQAAQLLVEALGVDKVDAFLHDQATNTLIATGVSDTPMSRQQSAIGMDRLPIANGGRVVEVFQTGISYLNGHAEQDLGVLLGVKQGLGVRSLIVVPLIVAARRRGVLLASSTQPDFFSEDDLHFLEAVARWVGLLIQRTELLEQMTRDATEQGRRLEAKELITVVVHELRNNLAPLSHRIYMIQQRAGREQRQSDIQDAEVAENMVQRLNNLISDLLDVARLDKGIFSISSQSVDLVPLVRQTAELFATSSIEVQVQTPQEVTVVADPQRVRQVLENLLANAVAHSPQEAPVFLKLELETRAGEQWAVITVSDQGPGVPQEILPFLFTPFVKDPRSRGLGLGLYLARKIATAHGGTLILDSSKGAGTHFQLSLPANGSSEL